MDGEMGYVMDLLWEGGRQMLFSGLLERGVEFGQRTSGGGRTHTTMLVSIFLFLLFSWFLTIGGCV